MELEYSRKKIRSSRLILGDFSFVFQVGFFIHVGIFFINLLLIFVFLKDLYQWDNIVHERIVHGDIGYF